MNKNNWSRLIDAIEDEENVRCFDMNFYHCGTTHCIGGWIDLLMVDEDNSVILAEDPHEDTPRRAEWLGVSCAEAFAMFVPPFMGRCGKGDWVGYRPDVLQHFEIENPWDMNAKQCGALLRWRMESA